VIQSDGPAALIVGHPYALARIRRFSPLVELVDELEDVCQQRGSVVGPTAHDDWRGNFRLIENEAFDVFPTEPAYRGRCKAWRTASSSWRRTSGTTLQARTRTRPISSNRSTPTSQRLEWRLPRKRRGFRAPLITELDLAQGGITNVIWATSYAFDFSLVKLPILDGDGFPVQTGGVTAFPGLYFVGLPWLPTAKSGLLYGVGDSARSIVKNMTERNDGLGDSRLRGAA
jgi:hypothetical protein